MLFVKINEPKWEYDVHSLVKAFYPREQVKVLSPERENVLQSDSESEDAVKLLLDIVCGQDEVSVCFAGKEAVTHAWVREEKERKNEFKRFFYFQVSLYFLY